MPRRLLLCGLLGFVAVAISPAVRAADVTSLVPKDAYGFVVINNLSNASEKIEKLLAKFDVPVPSLLTFLSMQTGLDEGVDAEGDLLVALLPGKEEGGEPGPVALLPVTDYKTLADAVDAEASGEISSIVLRSESFLIAQKGEYALLMKPEYRAEMEMILKAENGAPESISAFASWIAENDAVAVILPKGAEILVKAGKQALAKMQDQMEEMFGGREMNQQLQQIQMGFSIYDQVLDVLGAEVNAVAFGLTLDEAGNLKLGERVAFKPDGQLVQLASVTVTTNAAESLGGLPAGPFVIAGAGAWPKEWADALVKLSMNMMQSNPQLLQMYGMEELTDDEIKKFQTVAVESMKTVQSMALCLRPGEEDAPMMSGLVMLMPVTDSAAFMKGYKDGMDTWMDLIRQKGDDSKLMYDVSDEEIAGKPGLKISMDMGKMMMTDDPNATRMIEAMYGEGATITAYVGVVDEHRIITGYGSKGSLEKTITAIRQGDKTLAADPLVMKTKALLPSDAPWVDYMSPKGCVDFARRMMETMLGEFGGAPVIPEYPKTPPIGFSLKLTEQSAEAELVVPVETIDGLRKYIREVMQPPAL